MLHRAPFIRIPFKTLLLLALVCLWQMDVVAAPRLVVSGPVHDFGAVHDDAPITHTFHLKNDGDEPLSITRIRAGCPECTRFTLEREVIPAGESAALEVTLDTIGLEDDVEKDLTLDSNDPSLPQLTLWMQGTISPRFHYRPERVILELSTTNAVGRAQVAIVPLRALTLPLTEVESDSPYIDGVVLPAADGEYILEVFTRPPLPTGLLHAQMRVFSTDTNDPSCRVPVDVGVWPGFLAVPESLQLKAVADEQLRILFLRQFPDTPHRVTGVESSASNLTFEIYAEPGDLNYRITVFARGTIDAHQAAILVHTDDSEQPTLRIPVTFAP